MVPVGCSLFQPGQALSPWQLLGDKFGQLLWRQQRNVSFRRVAYYWPAIYSLGFMVCKYAKLVHLILCLCFSSVPAIKLQVCTSLCSLFIYLHQPVYHTPEEHYREVFRRFVMFMFGRRPFPPAMDNTLHIVKS